MPLNITSINLQRDLAMPLARQLYGQIYQQIVQGQLVYAERLPSSRLLAEQLQLSRGVVVECYDMLRLDGLVLGVGKGGTQVCYQPHQPKRNTPASSPRLGLSERGQRLAQARHYTPQAHSPELLKTSLPDLKLFPKQQWFSLQKEAWALTQGQYQRQGGVIALKQALRDFLARYRGIPIHDLNCLLITTGTQSALSTLTQVLTNAGDSAIIEHPCWEGGKAALAQAGLHIKTVPVDTEGAQLPDFSARLAILTPNAQFPTGFVMSVARREAWLDYSHRYGAWLIEDDYAAEYSYNQHPAPSLLAYPQAQQVIHVGTMSKLLLPDLRLGWMVVPQHLAIPLSSILNTLGLQPSYLQQQQLALFMQYGYLGKHLAHTRMLYNQRRAACTDYLQTYASDLLTVMPSVSGMNTYLRLHRAVNRQSLLQRFSAAGLGCEVFELEEQEQKVSYILFGHAGLEIEQVPTALHHLLKVLRECN
ncbi:PLP-dependent aminotransferase family protein [Thiofilum flexile]|uniref:aminotransferase-like domain-containing protein n=1 Tax=Thiofilum flexile TaxID=125627 RepID=UPI0003676688|nr:PLP-dependent aminotransferase family protein [Thiofilum flexile]